jgi:small-conductance mechanosensitive channel
VDYLVSLLRELSPFLRTVVVGLGGVAVLAVARRLLEKRFSHQPESGFRIQVVLLALTASAVIAVVLALPVSEATRAQLLGLFGIVLSAAIALSSTTLLGNIMAGLMLRAVRPFKGGDFIRVGEHFGRVSERELLHVEIQTPDRDLTTLPNLYVVTNPVTVVRNSGTVVSTSLSLGYDVARVRVEELLLDAAEACGLESPFVQVVALGDFSVTYRIAGLCRDVETLLSTRSRLRGKVMDVLHDGGVEIVSPEFRNVRQLAPDQVFIAETAHVASTRAPGTHRPEAVVFDKASQAATLETIRKHHEALGLEIEALKAEIKTSNEEDRQSLQTRLERLSAGRSRLTDYLATAIDVHDEAD